MRTWIALLMVLLEVAAPAGSACAQTVDIMLTNPVVTASPGESLTFSGSLTNLHFEEVEITGSLLNLTGSWATDDSPFLLNAPLTLLPASPSGNFEMFTVQVDAGAVPDVYTGTFQVLGGPLGSGAANVLGTASFSIDVRAVPEGDSLTLLLGATPVLACALWHRRRRLQTTEIPSMVI